jgi:hypothetical protein
MAWDSRSTTSNILLDLFNDIVKSSNSIMNEATGELSESQTILRRQSPGEGIPDGLAVDAEDISGPPVGAGGSIIRHAPEGSVTTSISFPVPNVSSLYALPEKISIALLSRPQSKLSFLLQDFSSKPKHLCAAQKSSGQALDCHTAFCSVEAKNEMRSTSVRIAHAVVLGPLEAVLNPTSTQPR